MTGAKRLELQILDARKAKRKIEWGEQYKGYKLYPCHAAQLDVLASTSKITAAIAGAQGGKTSIIPLWIYQLAAKNNGGRYLIVSPTYKTIQQAALIPMIEGMFAGTVFAGTKYNKQEATYRFGNGLGEIIIRTAEVPQNLDGGVYDGVVLDEAAKMSNDVWQRVQTRAAAKDAPILLVTTPDLDNFVADLYQKTNAIDGNEHARRSDDGTIYVRRWRSIDRPGFSGEAYETLKATMSPAMFARMFDAEYVVLEGLCYEQFADDKSEAYPVIKGDPYKGLPSPVVRFFGGNDWGHKDPSAILIAAECEDGNVYVVDEVYESGLTPDEAAKRAQKLVDKWALRADSDYADRGGTFGTFWSDVSRPEIAKLWRRVGIPIRDKRVADIVASVGAVDGWFRSGRLKVYATCPNLIRELRGYKWASDRRGESKAIPTDKNNHAADALRYMISSQKYGEPPTPVARPDADEAEELEKLGRLGIAPDDDAAKEREAELAKQRFAEMAFGSGDEDDPYGIWSKH